MSQEQLNEAVELIFQFNLEKAKELLTNLLEKEPTNALAHFWFGRYLYSFYLTKQSIEWFEKSLQLDATHDYADICRAILNYEAGKLNKAIEILEKTEMIDRNHQAMVLFHLGFYYIETLSANLALETTERCLELVPYFYRALVNKGICLDILGRQNEAMEIFEQLIKVYANYPDGYLGKGDCLSSFNKFEDALEYYDKSLALLPHDWSICSRKAKCLMKLKRYKESIESYERAIDLNANEKYVWPHHYIGFCYTKLHQYQQAIDSFNRAIRINPNIYKSYKYKATCLRALGRTQEADRCLEEAISNNYIDQGCELYHSGHYEQAIELFDKALQSNIPYVCCYFYKADCCRLLERYQQALEYYDQSIKYDSMYWNSYYYKGVTCCNLRRYEEALKCFQKAIDIDASEFRSYYRISEIYQLQFEDFEKANRIMIGAIEANLLRAADRMDTLIDRFDFHKDKLLYYKSYALYLQLKFDESWKCLQMIRGSLNSFMTTQIEILKEYLETDKIIIKRAVKIVQRSCTDHLYKPGGLGFIAARDHFFSLVSSISSIAN